MIRFVKRLLRRFVRPAVMYRYVRDSRALSAPAVATPLGFKFSGAASMETGQFEPEETALVQTLLPDVDIVINVGANLGYYCCLALQAGKSVVAFEPIELNVRYLLKNVRANGWQDRIEVFPLALGDAPNILEIYGGGTGASLIRGWAGTPAADARLVPVSTLDRVLGNRFADQRCLLIVDIEGAELAMLRGSTTFLHAEPKPVWMVEISIDEHQPQGTRINPNLEATFDLFWRSGYEAFTADRARQPVTREAVAQVVATQRNTFTTHNFLFVDAARAGGRPVKAEA